MQKMHQGEPDFDLQLHCTNDVTPDLAEATRERYGTSPPTSIFSNVWEKFQEKLDFTMTVSVGHTFVTKSSMFMSEIGTVARQSTESTQVQVMQKGSQTDWDNK